MDQQKTVKTYNRRMGLDTPINGILQKLCVMYLMVWSISPPLAIDNIYRIIALAAAGVWFLLSILDGLKLEKIHIYAIGFMLLVMLINVIENEGNFSALMRQISTYMLVIAFIMNHSYRDRWEQLHTLIPVFLLLVIVFNIITFRELLVDPTLARKIVRADEEMYPYMHRGVGGDALIYTQVFIFPLLLSWVGRAFRYHKVFATLGVIWLISYILLVLNAGYTIAIVTTITSLVVLLIYKRKSILPPLIITLTIIVTFVLLIGYADAFREALLSFFEGTKVAQKITDIYNSIHGTVIADSIAERAERYWRSIQTIFHYPLIGGLWFESGGGHSVFLDTFAKYGIWGIWIFLKMVYSYLLSIKDNIVEHKDMRIVNALLNSMIIVTLLETFPYEMIIPVMMLIPLLFCDIKKWRQEAEEMQNNKFSVA